MTEERKPGWKPDVEPAWWQVPWFYDETGQTILCFARVKGFLPRVIFFDAQETEEMLATLEGLGKDGRTQRCLLDLKVRFGGSCLGALRDQERSDGPTAIEQSGCPPFRHPSNGATKSSRRDPTPVLPSPTPPKPSQPSAETSGTSSVPTSTSSEETGGSGGLSFEQLLSEELSTQTDETPDEGTS